MSTRVEDLIEDIGCLGISVQGGPPVNLDAPLAQHLVNLGYRKQRTINTREDLDRLPLGSVVAFTGDAFPRIWMKEWQSRHPRKDGTPLSEWHHNGETDQSRDVELPVTLLWEPRKAKKDPEAG